MIKATDLRIGNWVLDRGNEWRRIDCIVDKAGAYIIGFKETYPALSEYASDLTPITLTPELLIKCGMQEFHNNEYEISYNFPRILGRFRIETERWFVLMGNIIIARTKYLHELQNLYKCLTGEELKIEL